MDNNGRVTLFNGFILDLARGCVVRAGEPVHLRPQVYEVLRYLVENQGHLISKDKLIEEVWKGRAVTDSSLLKCIEELRDALGAEAKEYIRNIRGRGYLFDTGIEEQNNVALSARSEQIDIVRVTVEDHVEITDSHAPEAVSRALAVPRLVNFRTTTVAAAGVLLVIIGLVVGYRLFTNTAPDSSSINSIAVLPFKNESGNADAEYLSDGISESLINSLSQLPQLKVIARSSTSKYKGKEVDPQEVAQVLNVRAIVTGRIIQRGDNLQISVELMDTSDKTQIWGEQYHRRAVELQSVQAEVARTVSEKLRLRLTGAQEQQLTKRATENAQAYQLYLTGMFHQRKANLEGYKKALDYFNQAVALDPNFALAFASMPGVYTNLAATSGLDSKEAILKGKMAAQKALELDETLALAHSGMAIIKKYEWEWSHAESEFKRAIELNPNLAGAHSNYSLYLAAVGRTVEALAENKRAQELDPLGITFKGNEGGILNCARRHDEALQVYQNVIKMQPDYPFGHLGLAHTYAAKGMYKEAISEYKTALSLYGEVTNGLIDLGYAYAMSGKREEALTILNKLKTRKDYVSPALLAVLHAGLGDKEAAFQALERAYLMHDYPLESLKVDPRYDSLRSDPRFQDLLRRVGLPA